MFTPVNLLWPLLIVDNLTSIQRVNRWRSLRSLWIVIFSIIYISYEGILIVKGIIWTSLPQRPHRQLCTVRNLKNKGQIGFYIKYEFTFMFSWLIYIIYSQYTTYQYLPIKKYDNTSAMIWPKRKISSVIAQDFFFMCVLVNVCISIYIYFLTLHLHLYLKFRLERSRRFSIFTMLRQILNIHKKTYSSRERLMSNVKTIYQLNRILEIWNYQ